jgi:hypothetical protein
VEVPAGPRSDATVSGDVEVVGWFEPVLEAPAARTPGGEEETRLALLPLAMEVGVWSPTSSKFPRVSYAGCVSIRSRIPAIIPGTFASSN